MEYIPDQMLLYMTEAGAGDWYHIPHQMVTGYLSRGYLVRERRKGIGWVELRNSQDVKAAPATDDPSQA